MFSLYYIYCTDELFATRLFLKDRSIAFNQVIADSVPTNDANQSFVPNYMTKINQSVEEIDQPKTNPLTTSVENY